MKIEIMEIRCKCGWSKKYHYLESPQPFHFKNGGNYFYCPECENSFEIDYNCPSLLERFLRFVKGI